MEDDWQPLLNVPTAPEGPVDEAFDNSWPLTLKWGVSRDGRTDVWRTQGGALDGPPTHRAELRERWGFEPKFGEGDQLGMAEYIPAERKLDGTLVAPPVILLHAYYGLPTPKSVYDWFEQHYPNTVVREAAVTRDLKGRPVKLAEWAPDYSEPTVLKWLWNQRDGLLVWETEGYNGLPTHQEKAEATWGRPAAHQSGDWFGYGYVDQDAREIEIEASRHDTPSVALAQAKAEISKLYPDYKVATDQDLAEQYGVEFHGSPDKVARREAAARWMQAHLEVPSEMPLGGSEKPQEATVQESDVPASTLSGLRRLFTKPSIFADAAVKKARRVKKGEFDFSQEPQVRRTIVHSYPWDENDPEDYENYVRDEHDLHDEEDPIQAAADWLYDNGMTEYSSSPSFVPHGWYSDPDGGWGSAKPEGFNEDEQRAIWAAIRAGDEAWRIPNAPPLGHPADWTAKTKKADADMSGAMIALFIPEDAGKKLKLKGGEPLEMLHITLVYFQDKYADRDDWDEVAKIVEQVANQTPKLTGKVNGYGVFNNDEDVLWAVPSIQGLASLREKLAQAVEDAGFPVSKTHDWVPHVTLAYAEHDSDESTDNDGGGRKTGRGSRMAGWLPGLRKNAVEAAPVHHGDGQVDRGSARDVDGGEWGDPAGVSRSPRVSEREMPAGGALRTEGAERARLSTLASSDPLHDVSTTLQRQDAQGLERVQAVQRKATKGVPFAAEIADLMSRGEIKLDIPELTFAHGNNRDDFKLTGHFEKEAMAFSPEDWEHVQRWSPYLYHATEAANVPHIFEQGLLPASEVGQPRDTGFWAPRPGHVYLFSDPDHAMESGRYQDLKAPVLLRVQTNQLDPGRLKADEDFLYANSWMPEDYYNDDEEGWRRDYGYGEPPLSSGDISAHPPLGQWAEQQGLDSPEVTFDSYERHHTLAHEGAIPSSAISYAPESPRQVAAGWGPQEWDGWKGTHRFVTDGKEVLTDPFTKTDTYYIGATGPDFTDLQTKFALYYPKAKALVHGLAIPTADEMGYGIFAPHAGWGHADEPEMHEVIKALDKRFGKPTHFIDSAEAALDSERYTLHPQVNSVAS